MPEGRSISRSACGWDKRLRVLRISAQRPLAVGGREAGGGMTLKAAPARPPRLSQARRGRAAAAHVAVRCDPPRRDRQKSLKIFLPLAAQSRYPCAWKMAYFSTEPASERRNVTGKNRVWDFFRLSNETHPANRRQPAQPRRKIRPAPTKSVSGIPYWPSRDPIEEDGGKNSVQWECPFIKESS